MDKPSKTLMFCLVVILIAMAVVHSNSEEGPKEVEEWFENLSLAKPKLTKLHFYFHDLRWDYSVSLTSSSHMESTMVALLTLLGQNPVEHPIREVPIVGGSGVFRLALGVAVFKTYFFNFSDFNSTVEVNVVAMHY
ncbi:unnamed protein product [Ilex paraguariensis]|uniref:Dirigent protein n=1 Tax=Ilex paraguariensis TaxID=185542 RepID=A0ABC8SY95_9AQUA